MDTKFSVAVHVLILISKSPEVMNSDQMAGSVGTNASYIRKILSLLKNNKKVKEINLYLIDNNISEKNKRRME